MLVSAAALLRNDRVLVQLRPPHGDLAGLWEFPGGKVEAGESAEQALVRELREELGIVVGEAALTPLTFATAAAGQRPLVILLFACRQWARDPQPLHASAMQWVAIDALKDLEMPPADRPLVSALAASVEAR